MTQHYAMLQRNLLYTGVTRGKRLVVLVGREEGRRHRSAQRLGPASLVEAGRMAASPPVGQFSLEAQICTPRKWLNRASLPCPSICPSGARVTASLATWSRRTSNGIDAAEKVVGTGRACAAFLTGQGTEERPMTKYLFFAATALVLTSGGTSAQNQPSQDKTDVPAALRAQHRTNRL